MARLKDRLLLMLAEYIGPLLVILLGRTCRYRVEGMEAMRNVEAAGKGTLIAFWHGRMLLPIYHFRREGIVALVSRHQDGEFIARILKRLGYGLSRGSPREGGREGFIDMLRALKHGQTAAIIPDGPTGPRYSLRDGIVHLARLSGAPIIPLSYAASPRWMFGSWDAFMLMKPFSRGVMVIGEPIYVPRKFNGQDELQACRERVRETLLVVERRADDLLAEQLTTTKVAR